MCINNKDALSVLKNTADYFLLHNRDIYFRADDSILCFQHKAPRFLRRSRGYAPLPVFLKKPMPDILACGGGLKSTICLTKENRAFLSQHIGDLDNRKIFEFYKKTIEHLKLILDIKPDIIVHDLHPGYMSTSYAKEQRSTKTIAVQHHHAHAVSCMAENNVSGKVIAVTLDGTGLGTDGKIWGGEVLLCNETSFKRMAHLAYVPMPGSEAAVFEPWRMGASYLYKAFGKNFIDLDIPFIKKCGKDKLKFILTMMEKNINSPMTSSCGRLFDAISALVGIRSKISFESQAAIELETIGAMSNLPGKPGKPDLTKIPDLPGKNKETKKSLSTVRSGKNNDELYDFKCKIDQNACEDYNGFAREMQEIDMSPAIRGIVSDLRQNFQTSFISKKFHNTVAAAFTDAALYAVKKTGVKRAVLSGGVFNNSMILNGICANLEKNGIAVYTHTKVPAGDGGISLGQAVIAGSMYHDMEET